MIIVRYGINKLESEDFTEKTVGEIRKVVAGELNIPTDAVTLIDGDVVNDYHVLESGDVLTFVKTSGQKGF